jgi:hypothetical protein
VHLAFQGFGLTLDYCCLDSDVSTFRQAALSSGVQAGFVIGASVASSTRLDSERRDLPTLLRIAPHCYNTEAEISRAVAQLSDCI